MSATLFKFIIIGLVGALVSPGLSLIECVPLGAEAETNENHERPANSQSTVPTTAPGPTVGAAADPFGGLLKGMTDLSSIVSSFSGPKVIPGLPGLDDKPKSPQKDTGIFGLKEPADFLKFFMNPLELIYSIARAFKLDEPKFQKAVGRGLDLSMETALQPPIACIKIIEKVFVPEACMLKFVCEMGKQLTMFKGQMPKFPDSYFEGASTAKALYYGASGRECQHVYDCKEGQGPILKSEFLGLKNKSDDQESSESN